MGNKELSNEINCQIPTLFSPVTPFVLGLPIEGLAMLASALGYDGLEHRGERSWKEASQHPNKRLAQISYLFLPHRTDSINNLVRLQQLVGEIPFTIYPTTDPVELELQKPLKHKLIQLAPDCLRIFGVNSLEQVVQHLEDIDVDINMDFLHYQRLTQILGIPADNSTFRSMLSKIKEVQVPFARDDFKLQGDQSRSLLITLLNLGYKGPIVPEINPMAYGIRILTAHKETVKKLRSL